MLWGALTEAAGRRELLLVDGGFCRFHLRQDNLCTIRELFVLPECRGRGVGRRLVGEVARRCPGSTLQAACPASYPSNGFWAHLGFVAVRRSEIANLWQRPA